MKMTYKEFDKVLNLQKPDAVPMYEHGIDYPIMCAIMGYPKNDLDMSTEKGYFEFWRRWINFYDQMGYPYVSVEMGPKFPSIQSLVGKSDTDELTRGYVDENDGPIKTIEDVRNNKIWFDVQDSFDYATFSKVLDMVPPHMKAVGGCSGGPFEHATFLMGLTNFCMAIYEDPDMVAELMEKISVRLMGIAQRVIGHEKLGVYRFGDDLGFTEATMISPEALRQYVFPWQKKIVEVVHNAGKKFLLHSCGKLDAIMDDLIDDVKIDAKHSFEDKGTHVLYAKERWGDRVAIIGGIDVDFLCRADKKAIYDRTIDTLKKCAYNGGYAIGSGNTITSYTPPDNYLTMVQAVKDFNGIK